MNAIIETLRGYASKNYLNVDCHSNRIFLSNGRVIIIDDDKLLVVQYGRVMYEINYDDSAIFDKLDCIFKPTFFQKFCYYVSYIVCAICILTGGLSLMVLVIWWINT